MRISFILPIRGGGENKDLKIPSIEVKSVGKVVEITSEVVVLHIATEGSKIDFRLDLYLKKKDLPKYCIEGSDQKVQVIGVEDQTSKPWQANGIPWGYADRKTQFKNLPLDTKKVIFWANEIEMTVHFPFDKLIEVLKS
jgi:hypothetical protein